jgi:hypothetical protein
MGLSFDLISCCRLFLAMDSPLVCVRSSLTICKRLESKMSFFTIGSCFAEKDDPWLLLYVDHFLRFETFFAIL